MYGLKLGMKNKGRKISWNMLKNTISSTIHHLQGTIYRLIRSTLKRSFVERFVRWEVDALSSRSKVKELRSKVEAICYRHLPSPSAIAIAIAISYICRFPLHPLVIIPTFLFHQKGKVCNGWFYAYIYNVQRPKGKRREGRVHTYRWPCAHGRKSFFRHYATGCAHAQ